MSTSEPSDSVVAMLIDGEEEQEEQQQTDGRTPMPERQEILPSQSSNKRDEGEEGTRKRVFSVSNSEGFFCPICMESWSSQGDHQVRLEIPFFGFLGKVLIFIENLLVFVFTSVELFFFVVLIIVHSPNCLKILEVLFF